MITTDDVAALIRTQILVTAGAPVPGGIWLERGPTEPAAYPYAVMVITAGAMQPTSGSAYVQPWTVRLAGYVAMGQTDPGGIEQLLNASLASQIGQAGLQAAVFRNAAERVLSSKPVAGDGKYAPELRAGADVFVAGLTVEILVQGDRSQS